MKRQRIGSASRRVCLSMTRAGLKAYRGHVAALHEIVNSTAIDSH